jgi:hypothetical protein
VVFLYVVISSILSALNFSFIWKLIFFGLNLCQRTNQDVSSPVCDVYHCRHSSYQIPFSTYFRYSYTGAKFEHNGLILFSLDGSGYAWLM